MKIKRGKLVVVSTTTGQSIKGVLVERANREDGGLDALVLRGASLAGVDDRTSQTEWHPLDGDVVIPVDRIDFWQVGVPSTDVDSIADLDERRSNRREAVGG